MAINPESQYPGKIAPSTPEYPYGSARNITVPGDGTGTPWEAALVNDLFGWQQSILSSGEVIPSGTPEEVGASQYLDALKKVISSFSGATFASTAAAVAETKLRVGDLVQTSGYYAHGDGGKALYQVVGGATGVDDGFSYFDLDNGLQMALLHGGTANVKQAGAKGEGLTSQTEDTAAFKAVRDLVEAGVIITMEVPDPIDFYYLDLIKFENVSNFTIRHQSRDTHLKLIPKDLAVITNTYVYQFDTCDDFEIVLGLIDGNKANQINVGSSNFDHECIDLKTCTRAIVNRTRCIDAVSEGIDLDGAVDCTIILNRVENCGGYGVHNSIDSNGNKILFNEVDNCGHDKTRGGIDAFKSATTPALNGVYIGNTVNDCYRNYNIEFDDDATKNKTHFFDSSNKSTGATVLDDVLTGVKPAESYSNTPEYIFNRGFSATGCRVEMPDANTLDFYRWKESTATDELIMSLNIDGSGLELFSASAGIDISPSSGAKWRIKRNGGDGFLEVMTDDAGPMERVFAVDKDGDIHLAKPGKGLVLVSPDGLTTRKLTIDNSGNLSITGP